MTSSRTRIPGRRAGIAAVTAAAPLMLGLAYPAAAHASTVTIESTSVSPSTISAGEEALQKVTLSEPAPKGGTVVKLRDLNEYEDRNYAHSTKRQVTVPEGQRSVTFPIRVQAERGSTVTRLQASVDGSTAETAITVTPPDWRQQEVTGFWVMEQYGPRIAVTGTTVTATVRIQSPAPVGGLAVDIRNDPGWNTTAYSAPYVVVPAGATSATLPIQVTADSAPRSVDLTADIGNELRHSTLTGVPKRFAIGPIGAVRHTDAGTNQAVVGLGDAWHPFGAVVKLRSDTPGITVPAEVSLTSSEVGKRFPVKVDSSVPVGTKARITAEWVLGPVAPVTTEVTVTG